MDYLINPIWFYLLNVCDGLKCTAIVFAVFSGLCFVGFLTGYLYENTEAILYERDSDQQYAKLWKTCAKWSIGVFIPAFFIAILCPDKQALVGMEVASLATKTNIEWTAEQLKGVVDYIMECIQAIK